MMTMIAIFGMGANGLNNETPPSELRGSASSTFSTLVAINHLTPPVAIQSGASLKPDQPAHIIIDSDIRSGVPCVAGGKWPIASILAKLAAGKTIEQLLHDYPELTAGDIYLALEAAAWVMRDPAIDWSQSDLEAMVNFQRETEILGSLSNEGLDPDC